MINIKNILSVYKNNKDKLMPLSSKKNNKIEGGKRSNFSKNYPMSSEYTFRIKKTEKIKLKNT